MIPARTPACTVAAVLAAAVACCVPAHGRSVEVEDVAGLRDLEERLVGLAARLRPSVVLLRLADSDGVSSGSGVVISSDGLVATCGHVGEEAGRRVRATLPNGNVLTGRTLGQANYGALDCGLVKLDTDGAELATAPLGTSEDVAPGEWVLTIGYTQGPPQESRPALVRAGRVLRCDDDELLFDAPIDSGDSGGPTFNMRGEVIGINSQIYSRTGGFMGLSFAIPIDVANDIAGQLKTAGKVTRGRIGVVIQPVTKELAESFGLGKPSGALVSSVEKGSPAEKAGIEAGDVILRFDGKPVTSSEDLPRLVGATRPGAKATVQLMRNKASRDVTVVVGEMPDEARTAQRQQRRGQPGTKPPAESVNRLGMTLSEPTAQQREQLNIAGGVLVEDVAQGAASRAGIRRGDVILAVNNQDVKSLEQFGQMVAQFEKGRIVALLVRRGTNALYIPLRIE